MGLYLLCQIIHLLYPQLCVLYLQLMQANGMSGKSVVRVS
jgi:hypothetical protein